MIIKIDSSLFTKDIYFDDIDTLLRFCSENRYELIIKDPDIDDSNYAKASRQIKTEILKEIIVKSAQIKNSNIKLSDSNDIDNKTYSIKDGIIYLSNSALIFMENANNDQKFIRSVLQKFEIGKNAFTFYKNRWLEFRHCGGKEDIINQINQELRKYRNEELNNFNYVKAIVICDSDRKFPSQQIDLDKLKDYCSDNEIDLHILEKREIENYLPLNILEKAKNIDINKIKALKNLTSEQQDFYDLEKGFNVNSKSKLNSLFDSISSEDYKLLIKGFDCGEFRTKSEIPKLFLSNDLDNSMYIEKCKHQQDPKELENIIEKINDLL